MATWSSKRKFWYALLLVIVIVVLIALPLYKLLYVAPTCFDNEKNGDEQGTDCGGSCTKLCSNNFLAIPDASWARFEATAAKTYNVAAYIVNPNPKAGAKHIPYAFTMLDKQGVVLTTKNGFFDLPPGRNVVVFAGPITIAGQAPARAVFDFDKDVQWYIGSDPLSMISVVRKDYNEGPSGSSLDAALKNTGALPVSTLDVYAILKDADDNVIDFSKTIVDGIAPGATEPAPFTWPASHSGQVISIEVLSVPE